MRVLITGGAGLVGKAAAQRLIRQGWVVRLTDRVPKFDLPGAEYVRLDILNYDDLLRQMRGCDAVIHLAAIPNPRLAPAPELFQINVAGTFNVFEAAVAAGIPRVVQASSLYALGSFFGTVDIDPLYFPLDEDHPSFTTDPYSFSKWEIEQIGAYYARRDGISSAALRFPTVYSVGRALEKWYQGKQAATRQQLDELVRQPDSVQRVRLAAAKQRADEYRRQRPFDFDSDALDSRPTLDDPLTWMYANDRFNYWTWIDERDAAQALEKAVTAAFDGAHILNVTHDRNLLDYNSQTLIRLFYPEATIKHDLSGASSLVSIEKARQLLGFQPEYAVQQQEQP